MANAAWISTCTVTPFLLSLMPNQFPISNLSAHRHLLNERTHARAHTPQLFLAENRVIARPTDFPRENVARTFHWYISG